MAEDDIFQKLSDHENTDHFKNCESRIFSLATLLCVSYKD